MLNSYINLLESVQQEWPAFTCHKNCRLSVPSGRCFINHKSIQINMLWLKVNMLTVTELSVATDVGLWAVLWRPHIVNIPKCPRSLFNSLAEDSRWSKNYVARAEPHKAHGNSGSVMSNMICTGPLWEGSCNKKHQSQNPALAWKSLYCTVQKWVAKYSGYLQDLFGKIWIQGILLIEKIQRIWVFFTFVCTNEMNSRMISDCCCRCPLQQV